MDSIALSNPAKLCVPQRAQVLLVDGLGGLAEIHGSDVSMVIAARAPKPVIDNYLERSASLVPLRAVRWEGAPGADLRARLGALLPPGSGHEQLAEDIDLLAVAFCVLFGVCRVAGSLEPSAAWQRPRRFARHAGPALLSCAYGAPGLRWRDGPWPRHGGKPCLSGEASAALPPHAVAVLKGKAWPDAGAAGAYVAPPMSAEGQALHLTLTLT
jgi:hypothetical protein